MTLRKQYLVSLMQGVQAADPNISATPSMLHDTDSSLLRLFEMPSAAGRARARASSQAIVLSQPYRCFRTKSTSSSAVVRMCPASCLALQPDARPCSAENVHLARFGSASQLVSNAMAWLADRWTTHLPPRETWTNSCGQPKASAILLNTASSAS
jgi:hypothetical protein